MPPQGLQGAGSQSLQLRGLAQMLHLVVGGLVWGQGLGMLLRGTVHTRRCSWLPSVWRQRGVGCLPYSHHDVDFLVTNLWFWFMMYDQPSA